MKRRFRFYLPIISGEAINALLILIAVIVAMIDYFTGSVDKATFWMIVAMFNYIFRKL